MIEYVSPIDKKGNNIITKPILNLLDQIRGSKEIVPINLIHKYMSLYLHNSIGKLVPSDNIGSKCDDPTVFKIGSIISYKNKYAIIMKVIAFDIILVIDRDIMADFITVPYTEIFFVKKIPKQDKTKN